MSIFDVGRQIWSKMTTLSYIQAIQMIFSARMVLSHIPIDNMIAGGFFMTLKWVHCKNYSNVHFKSQNYSCVLDSHTCLGDRISCCRKISGDKSKIKAVILMEIIKTTESRSQIYTGIFLSLSL